MMPKDLVMYNFGDTKLDGSLHINPLIQTSSKMPPPQEHNTRFNGKSSTPGAQHQV